MEVSSEISQKIRSAIKAKLLELGAYVDDELPDYIMVMVANKRSRVQMKADLGLFLGVNTDPFTGWLHALLGKLQTIKADSDKAEDKQGNAEMLSAVKDKMGKLQKVGKVVKRRKKIINKVVGDEGLGLIMAKTVTTSDRKIGDTQQTLQIQSGNSGVESEEFVTNDTSTCRENQIGNGKSKIFQDSKIVRQFSFSQASGDELAEKLQTTNTEIVNSRTVAVVGITKPTAVFANVDIKGVNKSSTGQYSSSHRKVQSSALIRKRRASTSVLDRVSKAEDEVYDPCNPAVCAVAARKFKTSSSLLQVDRALLLKAMTEAEHSIAVKRKVAVMRAMVCDNSPAEVYSPKRMQSEQSSPEESPPPYIPSRKDSISQSSSSCVLELNVAKSLQDDDSDYRPCQDDCRELISRYRHEGLLRTIGFDHGLGLSPHSESLKSHDRSRQWQEKSKNFTCERVVKSNNSSKSVHNFKITTNVVSAELQSVSGTKTHQHLPPLEQALQVTVSPNKESRISITSRLGKLVVERADSSECMQLKSDATSKVDYSKSDVKCRDGGDNSTTQRGQSKFKESNLFKGSNVTKFDAVIPSLGTVMAVQNQTKIAFVSRGKASVGEKTNIHVRHDRVGQPAVCVQRGGEEYVVDAIISKRDKADNAIQSGQSQEKLCVVDYESSDEEADDLAKMIDKEPRHDLYDSTTQNNELPLDLFVDSSTATKDKDIKTGLKRHENIEEKRSGTRFIVTLDGVDERQFDSKVSCNVLQKGKTSSASAPVKVAELYHSEQAQQKLFLDLLAVQAGRESQTLLQQMKGVIPAANILTPSLLTHALPIIDKSNKEFDDKQERAYTSRQGYCYPTKHVTYAETGVSAIKRAKMMERCKFWPACLAGPSCEYHHPTTRCKLFPNCKFGNKCLFIHPNCRFDSKCARADCPYTHTGHQATLASAAHVIAIPPPNCMFSPTPHKQHNLEFSYPASETTCRYFPNCQNINCPFVHPKPCKFGLLCKSPACQFYHPHKSHGQDRHKWQSHFDTAKPYMTTLLATVKVGSIFPRIPTPNRSSHSTTVSSTSH